MSDAIAALVPAEESALVTQAAAVVPGLRAQVDEPKGDPGNTLSRRELEDKALALAAFSSAASAEEMGDAFQQVWTLAEAPRAPRFFD